MTQPEFAEEKVTILVDEMAAVEAEDPTFGGMRPDSPLDPAYAAVSERLIAFYQDRYQHAPPADLLQLFGELQSEINVPHEAAIAKLLRIKQLGEKFSEKEMQRILKVYESFVRRLGA